MEELRQVYQSELRESLIKWVEKYAGETGSDRMSFGRFFLDRYFPGISDPEIFYEDDDTKAFEKIFKKYIK